MLNLRKKEMDAIVATARLWIAVAAHAHVDDGCNVLLKQA
jgi:hypothetical protein